MSGDSKRLRSPKPPAETPSLEKLLQSIVNSLSKILDALQVEAKTFQRFESIFERSSTLDQVVLAIAQMSEVASRKLVKSAVVASQAPPSAGPVPLSAPTSNHKRNTSAFKDSAPSKDTKRFPIDDPTTDGSTTEIGTQNYDSLERLLQKYEAEIRDHVRIEQQMKIYTDSLEESIADLEGKVKKLERESEDAHGRCADLQKELCGLKFENKLTKSRVVKRVNAGSEVSLVNSRHFKHISVDNVT